RGGGRRAGVLRWWLEERGGHAGEVDALGLVLVEHVPGGPIVGVEAEVVVLAVRPQAPSPRDADVLRRSGRWRRRRGRRHGWTRRRKRELGAPDPPAEVALERIADRDRAPARDVADRVDAGGEGRPPQADERGAGGDGRAGEDVELRHVHFHRDQL